VKGKLKSGFSGGNQGGNGFLFLLTKKRKRRERGPSQSKKKFGLKRERTRSTTTGIEKNKYRILKMKDDCGKNRKKSK